MLNSYSSSHDSPKYIIPGTKYNPKNASYHSICPSFYSHVFFTASLSRPRHRSRRRRLPYSGTRCICCKLRVLEFDRYLQKISPFDSNLQKASVKTRSTQYETRKHTSDRWPTTFSYLLVRRTATTIFPKIPRLLFCYDIVKVFFVRERP